MTPTEKKISKDPHDSFLEISEGRKWGVRSVVVGIWRFWCAPIFSPEVPKYLFFKGLGTSGPKIGAPQKHQILSTALLLNEVSEKSREI